MSTPSAKKKPIGQKVSYKVADRNQKEAAGEEAASKRLREETEQERELLVSLNAAQGTKTSSELLATGRGMAIKQAVVQCIITLIKSQGHISGDTLIYASFWILYAGFGYLCFTPRKFNTHRRTLPDLKWIVPRLLIFIVQGTLVVAVVTARSFTSFDRDEHAERDVISRIADRVPLMLLNMVQAIVLCIPVYFALGAVIRVQIEALWLALKMSDSPV